LVFVLLVSIGMSWLAVKLQRARRQQEAVEALAKAQCSAWYDYESENQFAEPPTPRWLRELLGDDFFFDVYSVSPYFGGTFRDNTVRLSANHDLL
jgi:hypothetical protein